MSLRLPPSIYRLGLSAYRFFRRRRKAGRSAKALLDRAVALAGQQADPRTLATPFVSLVVPVWNTPPRFLDDLVRSVRQQRSGSWQLILSDDASKSAATRAWLNAHADDTDLVILRSRANRGIAVATNAALAAATAPWVGFLDHDDALAPHALERILRAIESNPGCQHLYTDEVITDARLRPLDLFLKPAFDPVLISGVNYMNHLSLFRRPRLMALGGLREEFDGAQDYDLTLRYIAGLKAGESLHLPYPAYLWRRDGTSFTARNLDRATAAARRALTEAYRPAASPPPTVDDALGGQLHRVRFDQGRQAWPPVTVVIPNRDSPGLIARVIEGLMRGTDYPALDIVVIDNGSRDERVLAFYEAWKSGPVPFRADVKTEPFNFSRAANRGINLARGELILLLNNDIEIIEPNWLKEMVSCLSFPDTAIVGARLLYPNRTLQHAGIIAGMHGTADHWYIGRREAFPGPMQRLWVRQTMSAVTGACMLISQRAVEELGRFDEERFPVAYNDVDFCLRATAAGLRVVWTPFATLVHREASSRGINDTSVNAERFRMEKANLVRLHATDRIEDRAFSPWYSRHLTHPNFVILDRLPEAR